MVAPSNPPSCFVYGADRRDPRPVFGHRLNEFWLVPKKEKRKEREKVENHITTATKNPNDSDFSARKKGKVRAINCTVVRRCVSFLFFLPVLERLERAMKTGERMEGKTWFVIVSGSCCGPVLGRQSFLACDVDSRHTDKLNDTSLAPSSQSSYRPTADR